MLIPIHTLDTFPAAQQSALLAYANQQSTSTAAPPASEPALVASICDHGACARLGGPAAAAPVVPASDALVPQAASRPLYTLPAADGSDLGLRIKRGVCSAMVAIPFSLYLYFSLVSPRTSGTRTARSRKTGGVFASTTIRKVAHDV